MATKVTDEKANQAEFNRQERQELIRREVGAYYLTEDKKATGGIRLTVGWIAVAQLLAEAAMALREQQDKWETKKWQSEVSDKLDYVIGQNVKIIEMLEQMPELVRQVVKEELREWSGSILKGLLSSISVTLARVKNPKKMHPDDAKQLVATVEGQEGVINKTAALAGCGPVVMYVLGVSLLTAMSVYIPLCVFNKRYKPSADRALNGYKLFFEECESIFTRNEKELTEKIKQRDDYRSHGWPRSFNLCKTVNPRASMLGAFDGGASVTFRYGWKDGLVFNDSDVPWFPGHNPDNYVANLADDDEAKKIAISAIRHVGEIVHSYNIDTDKLRTLLSNLGEFHGYTSLMLKRIDEFQKAFEIKEEDFDVPWKEDLDGSMHEERARTHH